MALVTLGASAFGASTWNFGTINTTPNPDINPGGNKCADTGGTVTDLHTGTTVVRNVNIGNTQTCSSSNTAPSLTATAWSTTGSGSTYAKAGLPQYGTSGFGVQNATTGSTTASLDYSDPQHSMDNNLNGVDLIKLSFGESTILDSIGLGWKSGDSDISLFRYAGTGANPTTDISGKTIAGILASGWELVGDYANLATTTNNTSSAATVVAPNKVNGAGVSSSWWLISAYAGSSTSEGFTPGDDFMKVLAVASRDPSSTHGNGVPEPASLALMGAAMMGFVVTRRRKQKSA